MDGLLGMAGWGLGVKRRCETCRYFSGDDNAAGGRCLHPERVDAGLAFTVRPSELHCRSGWDKDLWEPKPERTLTDDGVSTARPDLIGGGLGVADGNWPENLDQRPVEAGVDILVDVAPSHRLITPDAPAAVSAGRRSSPPPAGDGANDRASIRRARDVQRLRLANRTRPQPPLTPAASDLEPDDLDAPPLGHFADAAAVEGQEPLVERERVSPPQLTAPADVTADVPVFDQAGGRERAWTARMAELGPVPPVPASEMRTDMLGWGANRQEAADRFDSIPAINPEFRLPFRERPRTTRLRAGFDDADLPARQSEDSPAGLGTAEPRSRVEGGSVRAWRDLEPETDDLSSLAQRPVAQKPAPAPPAIDPDSSTTYPERQAGESFAAPLDPATAGIAAAPERSERPFAPSRFDFDADEHLDDPRWHWAEPVAPPKGPEVTAPPFAPQVASRPASDTGNPFDDRLTDSIDQSYEAWFLRKDHVADVPRCCRTCRDFRPTEGGERGWCTSAWAFQHRRMVHADELPCYGAIGIWWLPSDDVWLDDLDFDHAEPTPLIDAMLARRTQVNKPAPPRLRRRGRS